MDELQSFAEKIVKGLLLRQRYMKASLQSFYKPTAKFLSRVQTAGVCNIFDGDHSHDDTAMVSKKSIAGELTITIVLDLASIDHTLRL